MTESTDRSFQRWAASLAILSAPIAYIGETLGLAAIDFDPTVFAEPGEVVTFGTDSATMIAVGMRLQLFGYFLLVAPAVVFLWYWLGHKNPPLVLLLTAAGLTYVALGAIGTAVNAVLWPDLMREYAHASAEQQAILETVFGSSAIVIATGIWGILSRTVSAVWLLGIGALLRSERRWLGRFTMALGAISGLAAVGNLLQIAPLIGIGTLGFLWLAPAWAFWLGVDLMRRPVESIDLESSTTQPTEPGVEA